MNNKLKKTCKLCALLLIPMVFIVMAIIGRLMYERTTHVWRDTLNDANEKVSVEAGAFSAGLYKESEPVFYVSAGSAKYHTYDCRFITEAKDVYEISENAAMNGGYSACKVCMKEEQGAGIDS